MEILIVLALIVLIGGMGFYVAHRPTVTPEEQNRIVRSEAPLGSGLENKRPHDEDV